MSLIQDSLGGICIVSLSKGLNYRFLLSCQPKVTVASCFVYKVIMDFSSIDHLCINPIHRTRVGSSGVYN